VSTDVEAPPASAALLERARQEWTATRAAHRDGSLRVGRLLGEYVRARLAEGDGLPEKDRARAGVSRENAVAEAAKVLRLTRLRINDLIRVAAVVDLLSAGGVVGALSWSALRWFRVLARRKGAGRQQRRSGALHAGQVEPSDLERWRVRAGLEGRAEALFAEAVAGDWPERTARERCQALALEARGPAPGKRKSWKAPHGGAGRASVPAAPDPFTAARKADPRDAADLIVQLVRGSRDPRALARLVLTALAALGG
jgi:hypothetical protein